jgi:hypothetical protein
MVNFIESLFSLPAQVDQWIVLLYVVLVLAGARIVEFVAKKHYERARNFAVLGFEYLEQEDQYRCPEGEHLKLLKLDNENRLAVYQISTSCQSCRLKESCTPHSHARHLTQHRGVSDAIPCSVNRQPRQRGAQHILLSRGRTAGNRQANQAMPHFDVPNRRKHVALRANFANVAVPARIGGIDHLPASQFQAALICF